MNAFVLKCVISLVVWKSLAGIIPIVRGHSLNGAIVNGFVFHVRFKSQNISILGCSPNVHSVVSMLICFN